MRSTTFSYCDSEGMTIFTRKWEPESPTKGLILIIHGISEHSGRYEAFAQSLTDVGFVVFAHDQRGHGKTSENDGSLGYAGEDGWNSLVRNVYDLIELIKKDYPGEPLFILGHSMGSFILRNYMHQYGDQQGVKGFILSGTGGSSTAMLILARLLCTLIAWVKGQNYKSKFIQELTFRNFNAECSENRTKYDWLSRDPEVVDRYIEDELCGQICAVSFYNDFFGGIREVQKQTNISKIPKDIPIFIFSGEKDPVGQYGKTVSALVQSFKDAGIRDITWKLYQDGRHEMLNEVNRNEVFEDIIKWIKSKM